MFVQANVQDRDLGGFMKELEKRIRDEVKLDHGMTIEYSGQYENQIRAERTLLIIIPVVLVIIFLLLFMVYRSIQEAAHVILAVPFALTASFFNMFSVTISVPRSGWATSRSSARDSNGRCHGRLPRRDGEKETGRMRRGVQPRTLIHQGRCATAVAAKSNDGHHDRGGLAADHGHAQRAEVISRSRRRHRMVNNFLFSS